MLSDMQPQPVVRRRKVGIRGVKGSSRELVEVGARFQEALKLGIHVDPRETKYDNNTKILKECLHSLMSKKISASAFRLKYSQKEEVGGCVASNAYSLHQN